MSRITRTLFAMSEDEVERSDELEFDRLENFRLVALICAVALLIVDLKFDIDWLCWPRAACWLGAAGACVLQARLRQRLRLPASAQYLWAGLYALVAALTLL